MAYINDAFEAKFDALNVQEFSKQLRYAVDGGRAEFAIPVLHRQIGTDELALCGAQKVGFRPDRVEAYPCSQLFNAFGVVASGHQSATIRQKILAREEITAGDMREMFGGVGARVLITHSAASALAIHHATREPVLVAMTPDNMRLTADYACALTKNNESVVLVPNNHGASDQAATLAAQAAGCKVADMRDMGGPANLMQGLANAQRQADARTLDAHAVKHFIRDRILAPLESAISPAQAWAAERFAPVRASHAPLRQVGSGIER